MKLKKIVFAAAAALFSAALLCGCDIADSDTNNLLRPPKLTGDEASVEQLIADSSDDDYTLKYPKNGDNRSSVTMYDLDGDGVDEAVAFYRHGDDITKIHMLVMFEISGEWKLSSDIVTETTDVDRIDFADVDGSGTMEILVGYSTYSSSVNLLYCYGYSNGATEEISAGQQYSSLASGDFNRDGDEEIISLLLYSTENEASASMLEYDKSKNSLYSKAEVSMDPNVIKYASIACADFDGTNTVVVDGEFASGELSTQIIYYNTELSLLRNPLYKEKSASFTQRGAEIFSSDIDNDGIVEIPAVTKMPFSSEISDSVADKISWYSFNPENEQTTLKITMAANLSGGYAFKLPESWSGNDVTAVLADENSSMLFYEWKDKKQGDKLLEIEVYDISRWNLGKVPDECTLLTKDESYAYTFVKSDSDSELALDDDEIKTAFSVIGKSSE